MKKVVLVVVMIMFSAIFLSADFYIKQQVKTGEFMGQPAKEIFQEQWFDYNRVANITPDASFILNLEEKHFVLINHTDKSYIEASLPLDISSILPEQYASMVKSMMEGMSITITPNGQTKKIESWDCTGYDVKMMVMGMEMKMVFWVTTNVPFDWKKLSELSGEMYKAQLRVGDKFIEEFKKIEGYPIATEMDAMGMKVTTTTVEIAEKTPGPSVYIIPTDYVKKDKIEVGGQQK